jgi:hypothetical protein
MPGLQDEVGAVELLLLLILKLHLVIRHYCAGSLFYVCCREMNSEGL